MTDQRKSGTPGQGDGVPSPDIGDPPERSGEDLAATSDTETVAEPVSREGLDRESTDEEKGADISSEADPLGDPVDDAAYRDPQEDADAPSGEAPDAKAPGTDLEPGSKDRSGEYPGYRDSGPEPEAEPLFASDAEFAADAEDLEEHHRPLAARVLTGLAILIVGGIIFLWGAPRLYPHLPVVLKPYAGWMLPGAPAGERQQEALAALRKELEERIEARVSAIVPGMPDDEVDRLVARRVAELQAKATETIATAERGLSERLTALADQVSAIDGSDLEMRLAKAETTLSGLSAQLDSLQGALAGVTESGGQISADTLSQLSAFSATVDGLRGELSGLAGQVGALNQRIDEVDAASKRRETAITAQAEANARRAEEERRLATLRQLLETVAARIEAGSPYEDVLSELGPISPVPLPDALVAHAKTGVPQRKTLLDAFPDRAYEAIRASVREAGDVDVFSRASSFLEARVATRSLEEQQGGSVDAILSRVEARLREDRAGAALLEARSLPDSARVEMAGWIALLTERAGAQDALAVVRDSVRTTN